MTEPDKQETVKLAIPRQVQFGEDCIHFFELFATAKKQGKRKRDKIGESCLNEHETSSPNNHCPNTWKQKLCSSKSSPVLDLYKFAFKDMIKKTWDDLLMEESKCLMQQGLFANKWMSFVSTMHVVKQTSTDVQMTVYNDLSYIPHGYSIKSILFPSEILGNKF